MLSITLNSFGQSTAEEYYSRGCAKDKLQDYTGAIPDYTKAIALDPNFAVAYCNRGVAKLVVNDKNGACLDLSKAVELGSAIAYDVIKEHCNQFMVDFQ